VAFSGLPYSRRSRGQGRPRAVGVWPRRARRLLAGFYVPLNAMATRTGQGRLMSRCGVVAAFAGARLGQEAQVMVGSGVGSLGTRRASAATVARSDGYALATGKAAHVVGRTAEGAARGTALPLLGSMRGYRLKMRKTGGRSRGGSGGPPVVGSHQLRRQRHYRAAARRGRSRPPGHPRSTTPGRLSFPPRSAPDRSRHRQGGCKSPFRVIAAAAAIQGGSFGKG
jgi:hypothetical protein